MYSVLSTLSLFSGHFLRLERQEVHPRFSAPEAAATTAATTATAAKPGSQAKEAEQFKRNNHILSIPKVKSSLGEEEDNYFVYRADLTLSTGSLGKNETSLTQIAALFSLVKKENRSGFEKPC